MTPPPVFSHMIHRRSITICCHDHKSNIIDLNNYSFYDIIYIIMNGFKEKALSAFKLAGPKIIRKGAANII